jgi:hypothetical protein
MEERVMGSKWICAALVGFLATVSPGHSVAQMAGTAVAVLQQSILTSSGQQRVLAEGAPVTTGDVVQTGPNGQAQLLFEDGTRIVVGRNSNLVIETALFRADRTAERFAINALRGSFRFISGRSASAAYSIRTPTATIGVRGTTFDFTVE